MTRRPRQRRIYPIRHNDGWHRDGRGSQREFWHRNRRCNRSLSMHGDAPLLDEQRSRLHRQIGVLKPNSVNGLSDTVDCIHRNPLQAHRRRRQREPHQPQAVVSARTCAPTPWRTEPNPLERVKGSSKSKLEQQKRSYKPFSAGDITTMFDPTIYPARTVNPARD